MAFGTLNARKTGEGQEANDSPFLVLKEGTDVIIRILDEDATEFWSYWFEVNVGSGNRQGRSLIVPRDNPIRTYMDSLGADHPNFRKPSHRARLNVLDRTPDNKSVPLNKVKILEYGSKLDAEFGALHGRARKRTDFNKKLMLWEFDLVLITSGERMQKLIKPMQHLDDDPLPDELLKLPRYDLQTMSQTIPNEALQRLVDGDDYLEVMKSLGRDGAYPMINP